MFVVERDINIVGSVDHVVICHDVTVFTNQNSTAACSLLRYGLRLRTAKKIAEIIAKQIRKWISTPGQIVCYLASFGFSFYMDYCWCCRGRGCGKINGACSSGSIEKT